MIEIKRLELGRESDWNAYVLQHEASTFFHLAEWKQIIEDVLGHEAHYLCALEDQRIVGVLPLGYLKSLLFGSALISVPFAVYGGALGDNESIQKMLIEEACDLAKSLNVDYLEIKSIGEPIPNWLGKTLYVTFRKQLLETEEENFKAIPRKQRAVVRKAIDAGLTSEEDSSVDRFFAMYSESVRNLGTPVLAKEYYASLKKIFGDQCRVLTILNQGEPVSSVMSFYFKGEVLPYYGGGPDKARICRANDYMYWALMQQSLLEGIKYFDFGRSKEGSGSYRFKKHWGFTPEPLHYQYHLVKASAMPDISPVNPKYQMAVKTWKKLPLQVANTIGPYVARKLG